MDASLKAGNPSTLAIQRHLMAVSTFIGLAVGLLVPPNRGVGLDGSNNRFILPPAPGRDIAAEAFAAVSVLRKDMPAASETKQRPLVMAAVREGSIYQVLVAEVIQEITQGSRAGTSWLKPLALRSAQNVTLAVAAEKFDPTLGWLGKTEAVPSDVHLFSSMLCPNAFVQTSQLEVPPSELSILVRTMIDSHQDDADADSFSGASSPMYHPDDMRILSAFMSGLQEQEPPSSTSSGGTQFYDPLG